MSEPTTDLETVTTQELVEELRKRSRVFFCCFRPIQGQFNWSRSWGTDGGDDSTHDEEIIRVLGLIELAKFDLLYTPPTLDELT